MKVKLKVKEMTMVKPVKNAVALVIGLGPAAPPKQSPVVCFYRPNVASSTNFFDSAVLKEALSKVLVPFYPLSGRFRNDDFDRLKINCNDGGILFIDVESSSVIDDFGDFVAAPELRKVTCFQCGGVPLGVTVEHQVVDGSAIFHFVNSWSRIARGLHFTIPPFIDRTILDARMQSTESNVRSPKSTN